MSDYLPHITFDIVCLCTKEELDREEARWIDHFEKLTGCFNDGRSMHPLTDKAQ